MKRILLTILGCSLFNIATAQAPQIEGDTMLCPWTNGTASVINQHEYDSYQWYSKFWFTDDEFVAIDGATEASFTYDWYTYDQSLFKVVVTLNGETYESNTIQIDSYAWAGLVVGAELNDNVTTDPENGNYVLCQGGSFTASIFMPYSYGIQWYRDGEPIEGANQMSYTITGEGEYYVVAAPEFCPDSSSSNETLPIIVTLNQDCELSVDNPKMEEVSLFPNPVQANLSVSFGGITGISSYRVLDATGKVILNNTFSSGENSTTIDVSSLSAGFYFLQLQGENKSTVKRFIKN